MIVNPRFSPFFKPLALAVALATAPNVHGAETAESGRRSGSLGVQSYALHVVSRRERQFFRRAT